MDFELAEPIADTLSEALRASDTGYSAPTSRLPQALAGFASRRWGWDLDPRRVRIAPDVGVAVVETLRRLLSPGDRVVVNPPVYPPFFDWIAEAGGSVVEAPLVHERGGWRLDPSRLEAAFSAYARAYLLCSPHNPLGLVHPPEMLQEVARLAAAHGVMVLADEIHAPLTHPDAAFTPFLSVSDQARRWGICYLSASKGWNLAGLKCGSVLAAHPEPAALVQALP